MKMKCIKKNHRKILVCSDLKRESINRIELDFLYAPPDGLLEVIDYNPDKHIITYDIGGCVSLQDFYKNASISSSELLRIIRETVKVFGNLEKANMKIQKIDYDFRYVFYNTRKRIIEFAFCPIQNSYWPSDIQKVLDFMQSLITKAVISTSSSSDNERIGMILQCIKKEKYHALKKISDMFEEDELIGRKSHEYAPINDKSEVQEISQTVSIFSGTWTSIPEVSSKDDMNSNPIIDRPSDTIDDDIAYPGDTVDDEIDIPGDTVDEVGIIRNDCTDTEYPIRQKRCIIGRIGVDGYGNRVEPDVAVTDNMRVSKQHAVITNEDGKYYITDLTKKGKTRLNGIVIPYGEAKELKDGMKIQLAIESFTFFIRKG